MKKHLNKVMGKIRRKKPSSDKSSVPRITNDTLAEHREAVIAKGKSYKYPMQQTKHRTVIISTLIALVLLASLTFFTWWQLYRAQNTSQFIYRITQILPLPVGQVDGETVLYREYLLELRSSLHYLTNIETVNLSSDDGQRQLVYQKRQALNKVFEQAYVDKLAREHDVSVSDEEVSAYIQNQIDSNTIGATEQDFRAVIRNYYDWTFEEYRDSIREQLLKRKVVAAVDGEARATAEEVLAKARDGGDFAKLAAKYSDDETTKQNGGDVGFASTSEPDPDGLIEVANGLKKNEVSDIIVGSNGLYIVKTTDKRENAVRFSRILISFNEFSERYSTLKEQGKVDEYIEVPDVLAASSPE